MLLFYEVEGGNNDLYVVIDPPRLNPRSSGNKIVYDLIDSIAESNELNNELESFEIDGGGLLGNAKSTFADGKAVQAIYNIFAGIILVSLVLAMLFMLGILKKKDEEEGSSMMDGFGGA